LKKSTPVARRSAERALVESIAVGDDVLER
jgi:hypothetical protein